MVCFPGRGGRPPGSRPYTAGGGAATNTPPPSHRDPSSRRASSPDGGALTTHARFIMWFTLIFCTVMRFGHPLTKSWAGAKCRTPPTLRPPSPSAHAWRGSYHAVACRSDAPSHLNPPFYKMALSASCVPILPSLVPSQHPRPPTPTVATVCGPSADPAWPTLPPCYIHHPLFRLDLAIPASTNGPVPRCTN